jgi:hypothetical protein
VWVYFTDEDTRRLKELRSKLRMSYLKDTDLTSEINSAALRACEANAYASFPPEFTIAQPAFKEGWGPSMLGTIDSTPSELLSFAA